jgi:hypothetical protein
MMKTTSFDVNLVNYLLDYSMIRTPQRPVHDFNRPKHSNKNPLVRIEDIQTGDITGAGE